MSHVTQNCRLSDCHICKGQPGFVRRLLDENSKMRRQLKKNKTKEMRDSMDVKLRICVGIETYTPTLEYPEYKRLPAECALAVCEHIFRNWGKKKIVIWTCSDVPVNLVGALIDDGRINIQSSEVEVLYGGKTYFYDNDGYLTGNWPFGVPFGWNIDDVIREGTR